MTEKTEQNPPGNASVFDINKIASNFPNAANTMLIDTRLTDEQHASSRVFRVYRPTPAHYHATCDEYLSGDLWPRDIFSGRSAAL